MKSVVHPGWTWPSSRAWRLVLWCLFPVIVTLRAAPAQEPGSDKTEGPAAKSSAPKSTIPTAKAKAEAGKTAAAPDVEAPAAVSADPSQTRKISPNEVFRDPRAEGLVDLAKLKTAPAKAVTQAEVLDFRAQAGGINANIDKDLMVRVVDAMVAKLTERANVQALVDPPDGLPANAPVFHGIQEATTTLLEPIFQAKSVKNQAFLNTYYRILKDKLTPQLKNHLIPRVQAMIILGEAGVAEYLPTYEAQLKDPTQTFWVKLWALEGMVNVMEEGGRLTAQDQILAAKSVADFLNKEDDIPWPVQLRAMEVLSVMRQGYEPNRPNKALMASTAMASLADASARLEVRSEAARALGLMQISTAVPKYNYSLVAHAAGQLAAELGQRIASGFTANQDKAKYWTALLIGPVYQSFDGTSGARDSGLLHNTNGASATYIQNVFELVKPVVRASIDLLSAGQRQVKEKQKDLVARVAALKDYLDKNAPADRRLVPEGAEFPIALLPNGGVPAAPGQRGN